MPIKSNEELVKFLEYPKPMDGLRARGFKIKFLQKYFKSRHYHNFKELILVNCKLTELPKCIGKFENLELLDLRHNKLTDLPQSIANLKKLKTIRLQKNNFKIIPEPVCNIPNLEVLALNFNNIKKIPDYIKNLTKLHTLSLSGNPITKISNSIPKLKNLEILKLSGNNFQKIPEIIGEVKSLKELTIFSKNISYAPQFIKKLNLEKINFSSGLRSLWGIIDINLENLIGDINEETSKEELSNYKNYGNISKKAINLLLATFHYERERHQNQLRYTGDPDPGYHYHYIPTWNQKALTHLHEYYKLHPIDLAIQYGRAPQSISDEMRERLIHEADRVILDILRLKLTIKDPVLRKIEERLLKKVGSYIL